MKFFKYKKLNHWYFRFCVYFEYCFSPFAPRLRLSIHLVWLWEHWTRCGECNTVRFRMCVAMRVSYGSVALWVALGQFRLRYVQFSRNERCSRMSWEYDVACCCSCSTIDLSPGNIRPVFMRMLFCIRGLFHCTAWEAVELWKQPSLTIITSTPSRLINSPNSSPGKKPICAQIPYLNLYNATQRHTIKY